MRCLILNAHTWMEPSRSLISMGKISDIERPKSLYHFIRQLGNHCVKHWDENKAVFRHFSGCSHGTSYDEISVI